MKKTLFMSSLLAMVGVAAADSTTITIAGQNYTFENVTNLTTAIPTDLNTTGVGAIILGNATRTEYNIQTGRTYKDHDVLNGYNGTIVIANGTIGEAAVSGGQLSLSLWGNNQIEGSYRLNANLLIGTSNWSEGNLGKDYGGALRLNDTNADHHITLAGQITLADNAEMTVGGSGNYIDGNISGAGKSFMLRQSGTLHLSGGATLGTLTGGDVTLSLDATKEDGTTSSNKVYNIGTLTSSKVLTLGDGVQVNLSSGNSSVLSVSGNNGTISVAEGATFTATAQDFGTHKVTGAGNITFTGSTTSSTNHDHIISADDDFTGTLTLAGRYNLKSSNFGNASKVVLVGDRDTNRTGFWAGSGASSLDRILEITGEYFVEFYGNKDITLNGTVTGNNLKLTNGGTVTFNEATSLKKLEVDSSNKANFAAGKTHMVETISGSGAVQFNSAVNVGNGKTMAFSGSGTTTANNYVSLDANAHVTLGGSAVLVAKDAASDKGIWIGAGADITISDTAKLKVEGLTISAAGTNSAVISRLNNTTAKLGVTINNADSASFLQNVKVTNADVVYAGSGTLYLGSMQGGSLSSTGNIEFAGTDSTIGSLTLSGNTITLGTEASHANDLTITSSLAVSGTGSQVNANLVMNSGTMTFADGAVLTMGCDVTIGGDVQVYITGDIAAIRGGETVTIINGLTSLDTVNLGSAQIYVNDLYQSDFFLVQSEDGTSIVVAPEPATATLSLLALAALAARRKRH